MGWKKVLRLKTHFYGRNTRLTLLGITIFVHLSVCLAQQSLKSEKIQFTNGDVQLSGELIIPEGEGPFPAIAFLHGSGPHTREGFRSYALKFAEIGLASLFYDKRGTGSSTGSWVTSSQEDLANDAVQAIDFLKNDPRINPDLIGLWCISQGGWVGPVVARKSKSISFAIIISGGGASPKESELFSYQNILNNTDLMDSDKAEAMELVNQYFDYLETGSGYTELKNKIAKSTEAVWYQYVQLDRILPDEQNRFNWEWVATYNPAPDIGNIDFPLLLMFGGKDASHPTELSVTKWKEFLSPSSLKKVVIEVFPEAGHGIRMRHIEGRPFAPGYEETMINWLEGIIE
ncbi:MAG: alpha/beta fold hydrolase [Cyclobacteriaceae bacterium]